jgi:hypothetical protein
MGQAMRGAMTRPASYPAGRRPRAVAASLAAEDFLPERTMPAAPTPDRLAWPMAVLLIGGASATLWLAVVGLTRLLLA